MDIEGQRPAQLGQAPIESLWGDKLLINEPLAKHTTFGIGGPADYFVVARTLPELCDYIREAWTRRLPYFVLGDGANLLVSDKGIRGLVIHNQCDAIEISKDVPPSRGEQWEQGVNRIESDNAWLLKAESGAALRAAAHLAIERGLSGLEWAVDVPGTVGGAVVGNAGAYGSYISDNLCGVSVFSVEDGERWLTSKELALGYRTSIFKREKKGAEFAPVILSATFALQAEDPAQLRAKAAEYSKRRMESQPQGMSAGSVFKRSVQYPAGFLIENAGLKGARVGGAVVSTQHANFIINLGTATARDVQELIELIRTTVYARFRVVLELEIELVGDW